MMQSSVHMTLNTRLPTWKTLTGLEIKLQYRWVHAQTDVSGLWPMHYIWLWHTNWQHLDSPFPRACGSPRPFWAGQHIPFSNQPPPPKKTVWKS